MGGVLGSNGKIYGIPYSTTTILVIDPITSTVQTNIFTPIGGGSFKYSGGVLSPNGKIYCIPYNANTILVIDPINSTTTTFTSPLTTSNKWIGGVLAENGKIYGIPERAESVLEISDISIVQRPAKWLLSAYVNKF
jgi:DNA-binding beta-propeller fold protein YncE